MRRASFWIFRLITPSPPCFLGLHTMSHAAKELHFSPCSVFLFQRHLRLILLSISTSLGGSLMVHMAYIKSEVTAAFNHDSLPP